jgi:AMMECR1 domain-containing protein
VKSPGCIGIVEDVKPVLLKKTQISIGNNFEEEDFYPDEL